MKAVMMLNRAIRRVPLDWQHPRTETGRYQPKLNRSYAADAAKYERDKAAWERGEFPDYADESNKLLSFEEWDGEPPNPDYYMPEFPDGAEMGICMYEETSEGTPMSAVYPDTAEGRRAMAEELAANGAGFTKDFGVDDWLRVIEGQTIGIDAHSGEPVRSS